MSHQHLNFWELAGLEEPQADQAITRSRATRCYTAGEAVLPLNRRFFMRATLAASIAVGAESVVVLASTALHMRAAATIAGLAIAVLASNLPLARASR